LFAVTEACEQALVCCSTSSEDVRWVGEQRPSTRNERLSFLLAWSVALPLVLQLMETYLQAIVREG